ncbi:FMN-binding protein [Sphaerochaeta sp. PS]|uniref:FMN-binding protein n=1 Tax=Sphaerochaeta sp. PS TaxID=3076336 RepID=UPI0028A33802|nr:FMN-binding protein [Sphaerochaeta sp. PS]MDT4761418.1 FMN-binding protein [Sphaerochaeta sp. PS]
MKKNLKYAFILLSICAVCAFALGYTNSITEPVIARQELEKKTRALEAVSNGWTIGEQESVESVPYVVYSLPLTEGDATTGYIVGLKGSGYGGELTLVASYTLDGKMLFAQMLANSETPGLGKKSELKGYMDKFVGTGATKPVPTTKDMLNSSDAAAVSGSSVTFMAVGKAIRGGSDYVKTLGGSK